MIAGFSTRLPLSLACVAGFAVGAAGGQEAATAVVPRPNIVRPAQGAGFALDAATSVRFKGGAAAKAEAELLAAQWRLPTGLPLPVVPGDGPAPGAILLELAPVAAEGLGKEGYALDIGSGARIRAATPAGLFYGGQTLRQLLPAQAFAKTPQPQVKWALPALTVTDEPAYPWRGFMLDYARHFFSVAYTKHLLDEMAARKMNVFHMHLTDDDGWRIEIKKYPKLTEVGAWRGSACPLKSVRKGEQVERYGGFFTQAQIKEIVAYAAARHIEVIPEIDMPGHALAWVTAYPQTLPAKLSDAVNDHGFGNNLLSPARAANFQMVDDILGELAELFPSPYVHIGGDEVDHWFWENCPDIQALMRREKMRGTGELQAYFTRRVAALLEKRGKRLVGWNEIVGHGLPKTAVVMSWTGDAAAKAVMDQRRALVVAHNPDLTPDMAYPVPGDEPAVPGFAGPVSFQRSIACDPARLAKGRGQGVPGPDIRGVAGCLWAEYAVPWQSKTGWLTLASAEEAADYKIFPRLSALADLGWHGGGAAAQVAQTGALVDRLAADLARLRAAGVKYRVPTPDVEAQNGQLHITAPCAGAQVRYTLDATDPLTSPSAVVWDGKPVAARPARFVARAFVGGVPGPLCFGARPPIVGSFGTSTLKPGWHAREVDLSARLTGPGVAPGGWHVIFETLNGWNKLEVGHLALHVDGATVWEGEYGSSMDLWDDIRPGSKVVLRADCRAKDGGETPDSFGYVFLEKAEGFEPGTAVATGIPAADGHCADDVGDFDPRTYFSSNRPAKAGETITWTFDEPEDAAHVEVVTGVPGALARDTLQDGILEISEDGVAFRRVAMFRKGEAKADFPRQKVKAVRVVVTEDQEGSWLAVQDVLVR